MITDARALGVARQQQIERPAVGRLLCGGKHIDVIDGRTAAELLGSRDHALAL